MPRSFSPSEQPDRLLSLDVLRGLTIAGMVLVTDPGTYTVVYPQLRHALWNGPTAADLIFPCFLFMAGLSMTLSFSARLRRGDTRRALETHSIRRSLWLIALGLLVNGFPEYHLQQVRIPGILQRIGICYLVVATLYLALSGPNLARHTRQLWLTTACAASLALYWALLKLYPTPGFGPGRLDPLGALPAVLDRAVFTVPHIFQYGVKTPGYGITFDPEGILSTLGALATTLAGVLAGEELRSPRTRRVQSLLLALAGVAAWLLSLGLARWMPLNKQIYTPTFALWSSGLSLVAFAFLLWLIDVQRVRRGWTFFLVFGTNAIFAFALSQFITNILETIKFRTGQGSEALHSILHQRLFTTWLPPYPASLAYAVAIVLLNAAIIFPLYRRRVFLRL